MKSILAMMIYALALPVLAADSSQACFSQLENLAELTPLRQAIALGSIENQTIDMMTNSRHPTAAEKNLIRAWVKERDQCYVAGESWRLSNMPANMRSVLDHYYAKNKLLIADLYLSKLTYGEFAIKRTSLSSELTAGLNQAWHEHQHERAPDPALEARQERQQAASRADMLAAATRIFESGEALPVLPTAQRNCTSERSGDYLYTICR